MTDTTPQRAVALAVLLVISVLAPFVGAAAAAPSGMVTVPDGRITEDVPAGESVPISTQQLRGDVLADDHANTLEVIVTTPERADRKYLDQDANVIGGGEVAIVLRDTESHDGRDVAIDAGLLREALGSTPEMIYGTHSSGETWMSEATYEDGYLRFHVEKFSSNTVTFSGEFRTTGTFSDGSTVTYQLDELDSASNVTVNLTGTTNSETDHISSTLTSGTIDASIAGTEMPPDTTLTIDGSGFGTRTASASHSTVGDGHSDSITLDGSLTTDSYADGGTVTITGVTNSETETVSSTLTSGSINADIAGNVDPPDTTLTMDGSGFGTRTTSNSHTGVSDGHSASITVDGSLSDKSVADGATVTITGQENTESETRTGWGQDPSRSLSPAGTSVSTATLEVSGTGSGTDTSSDIANKDYPTENSYTFDYTGYLGTARIKFYDDSGSSGTAYVDIDGEQVASKSSNNINNYDTVIIDVNKKVDGQFTLSTSGADINELDASTPAESTSVSASVGGSTYDLGTLTDSDTASRSINLQPGSETLDITHSGGPVEYSVSWTETTATKDPSITLNGATDSYSGTLTSGETTTLSVAPSDLDAGGTSNSYSLGMGSVSSDAPPMTADYSIEIQEVDGALDPSVDIDGDSTAELSHSGILSNGESKSATISPSVSDDTWSVSGSGSPVTVSADITETTTTENPSITLNGVTKSYTGQLASGETATLSFAPSDLDSGGASNSYGLGLTSLSADAPAQRADYSLDIQEVDGALDPSVDIDEDGTAELSHSGLLTNGETKSTTISPSLSNDTWSVSGSGSPVTVSANITETTVTQSPALQLNSNSTSYTGDLSDGETITRTIDKDALQEGENTINVSLPDQSADAPTMQVEANISHDATSKQTVEYDAEKYSERYSVSKTFASDRETTQATIPFEGTVTSIREVRIRENSGSWTTADSWSLDGTTLTVDVGSVAAGDTVTVRANGSKVVPNNGEIQVTDPAILGRSDDPKIEVTSRSSGDFELLYSGTPQKERVHYAYNETWTDDSEYAYFNGNDQHFVAPNVEAGDRMRIGTIPVKVQPATDDGDVKVIVTDPAESDPQYEVLPGSGSGDKIHYTYVNAKDDGEYELFSKTEGVVLDSGTANSPLTLTGTDDAGVVEWLLNTDSGGSTSDNDDISVIGPIRDSSSGLVSGLPIGAIVAALGVGALGVFGVAYFRGGREAVASVASTATSAGGTVGSTLVRIVGWMRRHPYVTATVGGIIGVALLATGAIAVPEGTVPAVFTVAVPIGAYLGLSALDRFSWPIWGVVTAISLIVGLVWFGVDLTGAFLNQQVTIILAVGGIYLLYQLIQAYQSPDSVRNIVFRGISSSETNTETTDSNRGD